MAYIRLIRIFLSSPGDVNDERAVALDVIDRLPYDASFRGRMTFEVVAWDKPGADTPMLATMPPQEAINQGLPKPSECDIVVVIMWVRMGTPLPHPDYQKPDGSPYLSGTEWEYEDAMRAARAQGRPEVIIYRRSEDVQLNPRDPEFKAKVQQWERAEAFFDQFQDPKTGAIRVGFNQYASAADFRQRFDGHLRTIVKRILDQSEAAQDAASGDEEGAKELPPPVQTPPIWQGSPFPGLRAFTQKDAAIFFGREPEIDDLIQRVRQQRFVGVVGASGAGKSSLVAAGLLPRLKRNAISGVDVGSKDWVAVQFSPGELSDDPFAALVAALKRECPGLNSQGLALKLRHQPEAICEVYAEALANKTKWAEILLFVDQFEELFTVVAAPYRNAFVDMLASTVERSRVIMTMRADFYVQCLEFPKLTAVLQTGSYPLAAPGKDAIYQMISRPVTLAGLAFEAGLIDRILKDMGDNTGALALLAYTLDELYLACKGLGTLTHAAYDQLGGVQGAIGERANITFDQLDPGAQTALPDVFRELVSVNEDGIATRQRAPLAYVTDVPEEARLVEAFSAARLLVRSSSKTDEPVVEVAHEALFSSWDQLANWIDDQKDNLHVLRQLRLAVVIWERGDQSREYLWSAQRARNFSHVRRRLQPDLRDAERRFIEESIQQAGQSPRSLWISLGAMGIILLTLVLLIVVISSLNITVPALVRVILGLVFVYSLLSILLTQIVEMIARLLRLRPKHIKEGIQELIPDPVVQAKLLAHPNIRLTGHSTMLSDQQLTLQQAERIAAGEVNDVTYIAPGNFANALLAVVAVEAEKELFGPIRQRIDHLPSSHGRSLLRSQVNNLASTGEGFNELREAIDRLSDAQFRYSLLKAFDQLDDATNGFSAGYKSIFLFGLRKVENPYLQAALKGLSSASRTFEDLRASLEAWFDEEMYRVSVTYRRTIQSLLLSISFVLVLLLNVDTLYMARVLWDEPILSSTVADATAGGEPQISAAGEGEASMEDLQRSVDQAQATLETLLESRVPIGWTFMPASSGTNGDPTLDTDYFDPRNLWKFWPPNNPDGWLSLWLVKLVGLAITTIAVSQGAPFWYDLLGRLTRGRASSD